MTPDEPEHPQGDVDWLQDKAEVKEQPFHSNAALIGPLIARFRELWNSVAAKWYVRPLLQQQNQFNRLLVERLRDHEARILAQDREQVALQHDLAEVSARLRQAQQRVAELEAALEPPANANEDGGERA